MSKVSAKLKGGLCNYMFQVACAYSYALKNNKECFFTTTDSVVRHRHVDNYKDNVFNKVVFLESYDFSSFFKYNEPHFHFSQIPTIDTDVHLDGDFQSEKHFSEHEKEIRELFSYPEDVKNKIVEKWKHLLNKETCSMHVRRCDYLKYQDAYIIPGIDYYLKASKQMPEDSVFLVFSDDIQWCKENFPDMPEKFIFVEKQLDYEDLLLMSLCKNNIIANSSFSWWGAWLNENNNKIVVAPKKWFNFQYTNYNTNDLYCNNWIKI